jgi:hypothetical protein
MARAALAEDPAAAQQHLARAIHQAAPEGFVLVFLEEGERITRLARSTAEGLLTHAGRKLAAALGSPQRPEGLPIKT